MNAKFPLLDNPKVLCVDDEPNILEGLSLHLGRSFRMTTALGAELALQLIENDGPYAVVVTDMRMPTMNGLEFLQMAKAMAPDTAFIMLTGSHDLITATKAVNEGAVFRFLNKPCPSDVLKLAIADGIKHYKLLVERREVLNETFVGSIRLMTDMLEMSHPEIFSRAHRVEQLAVSLSEKLGLEDRWELRLAVRLCRIGCGLMDHCYREENLTSDPTDRWKWEASVSNHLIGHIPRLNVVAHIVRLWGESNGSFPDKINEDADYELAGAAIVKAAWYVEILFRTNHTPLTASVELAKFLPNASPKLIEACRNLSALETAKPDPSTAMNIALNRLQEGMILAESIETPNGAYLSEGHRVSRAMLIRLHSFYAATPDTQIRVFPIPKES